VLKRAGCGRLRVHRTLARTPPINAQRHTSLPQPHVSVLWLSGVGMVPQGVGPKRCACCEGRQVKPASRLGTRSHFLKSFTPTAGAWAPQKGDPARRPGASLPLTAAGTMPMLRWAPGKVVFRACFSRLETKISVRPLERVRHPRSTQPPIGAKERVHAGAVHAQPPPRGVT